MGNTLLMTRVGDELSILRERAGMSRKVLADLSRLSPGTIQLIESGQTEQPDPDTLRRLSVGLATIRAAGRVDEQAAKNLYDSLMSLAGYSMPPSEAAQDRLSLKDQVQRKVKDPELADRLLAAIDKAESDPPSHRRSLRAVLDLYLQDRD